MKFSIGSDIKRLHRGSIAIGGPSHAIPHDLKGKTMTDLEKLKTAICDANAAARIANRTARKTAEAAHKATEAATGANRAAEAAWSAYQNELKGQTND